MTATHIQLHGSLGLYRALTQDLDWLNSMAFAWFGTPCTMARFDLHVAAFASKRKHALSWKLFFLAEYIITVWDVSF